MNHHTELTCTVCGYEYCLRCNTFCPNCGTQYIQKMATKNTVTATFPGIGTVEISKQRAAQILRLQKNIRDNENRSKKQEV